MVYTGFEEKTEDRRVRKTKKALRMALVSLLGEKSVEDITVKELTDMADIHRGTFYNHYLDVFDLKNHMEKEISGEFELLLSQYPYYRKGETPYDMIAAALHYFEENREVIPMLLNPAGDPDLRNKIYGGLLERCLAAYLPSPFPGTQSTYIYENSFCESGIIGMLNTWMENGMRIPPEELAALLCRMLQNSTIHV